MVKSAYIHIPFCKSRCNYCSFVSFEKLELKKEYLKTLAKEIKYFYEGEVLETLYIGGGTPSLLDVCELDNILKLFRVNDKTEITLEVNPEGGSYGYFRGVRDAGVNRISLGCQSFDDNILRNINRRHNAGQIIDAVKSAQDAGLKNISLDLIYGLPNQTPDAFLRDLGCASELGVQHISLYGLKLEEGCYFYSNMPDNLPDDDTQADMYLEAAEYLEAEGFARYEVSNFSRLGFNSRHNMVYWDNKEYYGFGAGAHGYRSGVRYANADNLDDYLDNYINKKDSKLLSRQEILEEEIFLGLRRVIGIDVMQINSKFGIDFEEKYKNILEKYTNSGLMKKTGNAYSLTLQGVLVSNVILADFI